MKNELKCYQKKMRKLNPFQDINEDLEYALKIRKMQFTLRKSNFTKDLNRLNRALEHSNKKSALLAKKLNSKIYKGK